MRYQSSQNYFNFKYLWKKLRIGNFQGPRVKPVKWGGYPTKMRIFKYCQYWWCRKLSPRHLLRLDLLWEVWLSVKAQEIDLVPISVKFLTILGLIQNVEFSILADIWQFPHATFGNWSISNIPLEIDCASILKSNTYIDSSLNLAFFGSKTKSKVEKPYSHCEIDWLLSDFTLEETIFWG